MPYHHQMPYTWRYGFVRPSILIRHVSRGPRSITNYTLRSAAVHRAMWILYTLDQVAH
jgi:hypothetical protein